MNKSQALKLAQKRWRKSAYVEERPQALDEAAKQEVREQLNALKAQLNLLLTPTVRKAELDVLRAAEFVADVDGDAPSVPQLQTAVAEWRKQTHLAERQKALLEEIRQVGGKLLGYRCTIGWVNNSTPGFPLGMVQGQGDSWQQAAEKAGLVSNTSS